MSNLDQKVSPFLQYFVFVQALDSKMLSNFCTVLKIHEWNIDSFLGPRVFDCLLRFVSFTKPLTSSLLFGAIYFFFIFEMIII